MKYRLPKAIRNLTPYEPVAGRYRIRLDANESFFRLEPLQLQAFSDRLQEISFHRYPDPAASRLCEAFATCYGINRDLVTAFNGSDEALSLLASAFFSDGQKLAVFDRDFSMYRVYAETFGTACEVIPKQEDGSISVDETLSFIQERGISALLFSNPCNPTSLGLSRAETLRLVKGTDALVIVDEAYMDFWDQSLLDQVGKQKNLMILRTCSKAIGFAAARIGFAVAAPPMTRALRAVKSPYNVNALSQAFGEILLEDRDYLENARRTITENRRALEEQLRQLAGEYGGISRVYPSCTNFVYLETEQAGRLAGWLKEHGIAVRCFDGALRITAGSAHENRVLVRELRQALQEAEQ